jgi:hypothetical protein
MLYEIIITLTYSFIKHRKEDKFAKDVGLYKYSEPVQRHFTKLIKDGQVAQAASMLGKYTGHEFVGRLGYATHPIGWGTNFGRLLTQFGQWPIHQLQTMAQLAAKGDAGVYARGLATYTAVMGASIASGINLEQWTYSPTNYGYLGGPFVGLTDALAKASMHPDPYVRNFYKDYISNRYNFLENPKQIFIPVPFQFWNMLEGLGLYEQSERQGKLLRDNPFLAGAKFLGFSVKPVESLFGFDITK